MRVTSTTHLYAPRIAGHACTSPHVTNMTHPYLLGRLLWVPFENTVAVNLLVESVYAQCSAHEESTSTDA